MPKIRFRPIAFSLLNATLMLSLALFWLRMPRIFGDEAFFIKWTSLVKKTVLGMDDKPEADDFLYVDVSRAKSLVGVPDPLFEFYTGYSHVAITDRAQLAEFLGAISQYGEEVEGVVMDIFFRDSTEHDSTLQAAIDTFPFPICSAATLAGAMDKANRPIQISQGVAVYLSVDENFMKYPLYYDTFPTLPLVALGKMGHASYGKGRWWVSVNDQLSLSNPVIDFKVRPFDFKGEQRYFIHEMGSLLFQFGFWEEADIRSLLSGKTIIIGDFYNDTHATVFGSVPGPMIIHNAILTLKSEETLIRWQWIAMLLLLFFWMSWRVYEEERSDERSWLWNHSQTALGKIVADSIDDTFFLIVGTVLSYLIFNIHINILVLLLYLKAVAYLLRRFVFRRGKSKPDPEATTVSD